VRPHPRAYAVSLTPREAEVAILVACGWQSQEIGAYLGVTRRTVESQIHSICVRLGLRNRAQIAFWVGKTCPELWRCMV
jgi:DNA-binding NarL/FixJ family response regulator